MDKRSTAANLLIEASAGTGKTQALAERLIELVLKGVRPSEIVALTFSRAAAGEIFERFVTLLAERARTDGKCLECLREVVANQHLSQIGTLDSFLMRIVSCFPLELGLSGTVKIMDDYDANCALSSVSFNLLRRTDPKLKTNFVEAFSLAMNHENVRSFVNSYRTFIRAWHELVLAYPSASAWGAFDFEIPEVTPVNRPELIEFFEWVKKFRGSFAGVKGLTKKFLENENVFDGATIEITFNRKEYVYSGNEAKAIRDALRHVFGVVLRMRAETAAGIYRLISAYEKNYALKVRNRGELVFADIPRLISALDDDSRLALEYRLDSKIRAWALDEFQDTSREQWRAIRNLIDEAKMSDGEKSVFVVGDVKQAIYGWRNGDVDIFRSERESGGYTVGELKKSYRFGPAITEAVNRIFVDGRLKQEFPAWRSSVHETAHPERTGFVQRVEALGTKKQDFVEPIYNALKAVDPIRRGINTAILVRTNDFGELLAAQLKARGLENVVWEGESDVLDTPALAAFLDLTALADHPGDRLAYEHFKTTPLARAKYPDGVPEAGVVSSEVALAFTTKGMVRTFRELRACLPAECELAWDRFTEERFTDMLKVAAEFETLTDPGRRLSDFAGYLATYTRRNLADAGKIKIMTIHRSKGLGFDYVVLPLYEPEGLTVESDRPLTTEDWVLPKIDRRAVKAFPFLEEAWRERQDRAEQENLCLYYVAMTRAKHSLTLVLNPEPAKSITIRFSTLVRSSLPESIGEPDWYKDFTLTISKASKKAESMPAFSRSSRQHIVRKLPSLAFASGESASTLFVSDSARHRAQTRGIEAHERMRQVEFSEALPKPEGFVELWRERAFEVFAEGEWISGRFDRVVFFKAPAGLSAEIVDFKTSTNHPEQYDAQLLAYRKAVNALTKIPLDRITARLVFLV